MRPFQLARIAAKAELVRLRGMATRMATRVVLAIIALLFLLGTLIFVHIEGWFFLRMYVALSSYASAAILGGIDLLIAVILLLLARSSTPSRTEREALEVRQRAVEGMRSAANMTQLALPAVRFATSMRRRRRRH